MGVELALAQESDEPVPTPFTACKRLTAWRADGALPRHGLALQRAGVAAGVDAVRKWRRARRECERDAAYWTERALSDEAPRVLRKAARATKRLERHSAAGQHRLYRSLKRIRRSAGPALIYSGSARLAAGMIVLPSARGAAPLRLAPAEPFAAPDGWEWTGAVQLVDISDRKGRSTAATSRACLAELHSFIEQSCLRRGVAFPRPGLSSSAGGDHVPLRHDGHFRM